MADDSVTQRRRRRQQAPQPGDEEACCDESTTAASARASAEDENTPPVSAGSKAANRRQRRNRQEPEPTEEEVELPGRRMNARAAASEVPPEPPSPASTDASGSNASEGAAKMSRSERRRLEGSLAPARSLLPVRKGPLPEEERRLLEMPIKLDKGDLFRGGAPQFLHEPPAPALGNVTLSYVEIAGAMDAGRFRCISRDFKGSADPGGSGHGPMAGGPQARGFEAGRREPLRFGPSGGTQVVMLCIGIALNVAQGALAGLTLMMLAVHPWPDEAAPTLLRPMTFAPLVVPMQRVQHVLASFSFLGAADLHAASPSYGSGLVLLIYVGVIITLVLELPTDVGLTIGRERRQAVLVEALDFSLGLNTTMRVAPDGSLLFGQSAEVLEAQPFKDSFMPERLASMQFEPHTRDFFETALSEKQLSFWTSLLWTRAVLATISWVLFTLMQAGWAFTVPPVSIDRSQST
jgi:hypothetical protein